MILLTRQDGKRGQKVLCSCCNASGSSSWSCSRRPASESAFEDLFSPTNCPDGHLRSAGVVARVRHGAAALLQVVPHHQRHLPHSRVGPALWPPSISSKDYNRKPNWASMLYGRWHRNGTGVEGAKVISLKIILFAANGMIDQDVTLLLVFYLFSINFA